MSNQPLEVEDTTPVNSFEGEDVPIPATAGSAVKTQPITPPPSTATSSPSEADILAPLGEFTVYNPPSGSESSSTGSGALASAANLPDSYFEPTAADLKYAQISLSAKAKALIDAPLQTTKLRTEKEEEKRKRWPNARIRVKFANQTMLEKTFPSSDKIKSIYAFVRGCLNEEAKQHKFVLFTTPPRRDLKVSDTTVRDKSLYDLHLAPSGVLMFVFLDESLPYDSPSSPPPLHPAILSRAIDLPLPPSLDPPSSSSPSNQTSSPSSMKKMSSSGPGDRKLPKWFKIGQKK